VSRWCGKVIVVVVPGEPWVGLAIDVEQNLAVACGAVPAVPVEAGVDVGAHGLDDALGGGEVVVASPLDLGGIGITDEVAPLGSAEAVGEFAPAPVPGGDRGGGHARECMSGVGDPARRGFDGAYRRVVDSHAR
jgi:hypothetical protein